MAVGDRIEDRNHITGFKEEIKKAKDASRDAFFTWFNAGKDADEVFLRGSWDFACHIVRPVERFVKNPENLTVLEIGHGGGRILAAAARFFGRAIGVDIHEDNELVLAELKRRGIENIELVRSDGTRIPLEDNSIDIVYSFIVLQHVEKIEIFQNYFREAYRVLKPHGIAVLYFGREYKYSINKRARLLYLFDRFRERYTLKNGYREIPARVNETNLRVSLSFARKLSRETGFKVAKNLVSRKKVPDGLELYGGQNGLVLLKNLSNH
ncbi:MAG: class I SAM-dependent methyltransferase [Nitrospirota bacterium]